ncbi:Putative phage/plasmid replication protein [Bacillus subtilis]|nr:Putative phage/plasmid replication protein [Bacillus subtilis]
MVFFISSFLILWLAAGFASGNETTVWSISCLIKDVIERLEKGGFHGRADRFKGFIGCLS